MARYATGKHAKAISDRSGLEYRYKDMRKEWNGLLVGKDEFERKHPQLGPFRKVYDPQTLKDPRPNNNSIPATVKFPHFLRTVHYYKYELVPRAYGSCGNGNFWRGCCNPYRCKCYRRYRDRFGRHCYGFWNRHQYSCYLHCYSCFLSWS